MLQTNINNFIFRKLFFYNFILGTFISLIFNRYKLIVLYWFISLYQKIILIANGGKTIVRFLINFIYFILQIIFHFINVYRIQILKEFFEYVF